MGALLRRLCRTLPRVTILTCFSRSAHALRKGDRDVAAVTRLRKQEDARLCARLGPVPPVLHYLDLPDAPLRPGRGFHNLFGRRLVPAERPLAQRIAAAVRELLAPDALLLYPLGIGAHVDHLIARVACDDVARTHRVSACYEDQPYRALIAKRRPGVLLRGLTPVVVASPDGKSDLLDCYGSQLLPAHRAAMLRYARELAGGSGVAERLWVGAHAGR